MNRYLRAEYNPNNVYEFKFSEPIDAQSVSVKSIAFNGIDLDDVRTRKFQLYLSFDFHSFFGWNPPGALGGILNTTRNIDHTGTNYDLMNYLANELNDMIPALLDAELTRYAYAYLPGTVSAAVTRYKIFNFVSLEFRASATGLTALVNAPNDFDPSKLILKVGQYDSSKRLPIVSKFNVMRYDTARVTSFDEAVTEFFNLTVTNTANILRGFQTNCSFLKGYGLTFCNATIEFDLALFANQTFDKILVCSSLPTKVSFVNLYDTLNILDTIDIDNVFSRKLLYEPNPRYYKKLYDIVPETFTVSFLKYDSLNQKIKPIDFATVDIELRF